jgi:hypothetical protein
MRTARFWHLLQYGMEKCNLQFGTVYYYWWGRMVGQLSHDFAAGPSWRLRKYIQASRVMKA